MQTTNHTFMSSGREKTPAAIFPPTSEEAAIQPSGPRGDNPSTAGPGQTSIRSNTPENAEGHINPSPEDTNATPGTVSTK